MSDNDITDILAYHERTKHRFGAYAKGPANIDWDAQPDPFRRFDGAHEILLPFRADIHPVPYAALFGDAALECMPPSLQTVALMLEISVALSAWKQYGKARWSLRCNPSSGNLHPTETYVIACGIDGLGDGVYHYRADIHALEFRCAFKTSAGADGIFIGFSSVFWREAWKYGERAYRYCQHDCGHALAAISLAAATLGWQARLQTSVNDIQLAELLGLDRQGDFGTAEREHPEVLLRVDSNANASTGMDELLSLCQNGQWIGSANILDRRHFHEWPAIEVAASLCARPPLASPPTATSTDNAIAASALPLASNEPAADLFRRRRSAQAFDGKSIMPQQDFHRLLDHVLPRTQLAPWHAMPWQPRIHLVLFVHRVQGLVPGLYALPRTPGAQAMLQQSLRDEFLWSRVDSAPAHLGLFQLLAARCERTATTLSCQQAIAGDSCFSLAMLAEFESHVADAPWRYRELFQEAGAIGQMLYLDAEACSLRATGIGCYFDDEVHEVLGIKDRTLQSLYHFTVGMPLQDTRIVGLPPYDYSRRSAYTSAQSSMQSGA